MISISRFAVGHEQDVRDLIVPIQREEFGIPITYEEQSDLRDIPGFYQVNKGDFWLASDDEKAVGSIGLLDIGNGDAALRKMFVAPAYRGKPHNVASLLLDTLLRHAASHDLKKIYLGTTEKFLAAHRFYEKNGFHKVELDDLPEAFPRMQVDTIFYGYGILAP